MIESVELNNFISYKSQTIKLDEGITALIGSNGAGKSAILDAVMFSFFGENGRDVNVEDLQRIGENQMYTKTTFKIKGTKYSAFRHYVNGKKKKIELQDESGNSAVITMDGNSEVWSVSLNGGTSVDCKRCNYCKAKNQRIN